MARDEDLFARAMASLGVDPISGKSGRSEPQQPRFERQTRSEIEVEPTEGDMFLRAMNSLTVVPNKDHRVSGDSDRGPRRLKQGKKPHLDFGETIDLHGKTVAESLETLARVVTANWARGRRSVMVITGKGHHSKGGVSVVRRAVENWILTTGKRYVEAYADAPRAFGGSGAFVIYLKKT